MAKAKVVNEEPLEKQLWKAADKLRKNFVESNPKITTKELKALLDIGDTKAKELFKSLTEKNKLQRKGSGRSTYYVRVE
jgi:predicted HTH transcriptional regulator